MYVTGDYNEVVQTSTWRSGGKGDDDIAE